uniref:RNA-directed RNA polymerase n=1 Tax=Daqing Totiv tick virus 1 TaxID=2972356 RepID=A0A9E7V2F6_9VIRU|nr:MAG: RNA-dependent RNA polymerase [Daqing Totiv tick virus 1]
MEYKIYPCKKNEYNFLLVRIIPDKIYYGLSMDYYAGGSYKCFYLPTIEGYTAVYYDYGSSYTTKKDTFDILALNLSNSSLYYNYLEPLDLYSLLGLYNKQYISYTNTNAISSLTSVESIMTYLDGLNIPDFASDYHLNIKPGDMYDAIKDNLGIILEHVDIAGVGAYGKVALMTVILWFVNVGPLYQLIGNLWGIGSNLGSVKDWIGNGKELSIRCKSIQNLIPFDLKPLFEVHNLINRIETGIDWANEKDKRVNPNVAILPRGYVYNTVKGILRTHDVEGRNTYRNEDWRSFWLRRLEWSTVGSVFDIHRLGASATNRDLNNKLYYINNLKSDMDFERITSYVPAIHAKTSIKYEWSKQRAIYGCDVLSYILFSFAMGDTEETLSDHFACGSLSDEASVKGRVGAALINRQPMCLDFDDFNSQHSTNSIREVLLAFRDVFLSSMSSEQSLAMDWCIKSIDNVYVHDTIGLKEVYKASGTLFSGWKLTTFVNSCLNYVYYKAISIGNPLSGHLHAGDDIIVGVNNTYEYLYCMRRAQKYNIRLSDTKCNYGSVAEFLRVDHRSTQTGQYLARSLTTYVMGRIETTPSYDMLELIKSYFTRSAACISRGGNRSVIIQITTNVINRLISNSIKYFNYKKVFYISRVCGGLRKTPRVCQYSHDISNVSCYRDIVDNYPDINLDCPGVKDYCKSLEKYVTRFNLTYGQVYDIVKLAFLRSFVKIKARYSYIENDPEAINRRRMWDHLFPVYRDCLKKHSIYGRARQLGSLLDLLQQRDDNHILSVFTNSDERVFGLRNMCLF